DMRGPGSGRMALSAAAVMVPQGAVVAVDSAVWMEPAGRALGDVLGANFALAAVAAMIACVAVLLLVHRNGKAVRTGLALSCVVLVAAAVATSHAASRVELRWLLSSLTTTHILAAFVWIGGLPYLLAAIARSRGKERARTWTRRFSRVAMVSVAGLALSGVAMASLYIDSPRAVYGTAYGVMLAAKAALLALLLL